MSSFWDLLGERVNEGTMTKAELLTIIGDLHSIDHATNELLSYILYKAHPDWIRKDPKDRGHVTFLSEKTIKALIAEHKKIQDRKKQP